jgi:hypothetical protein
MSAQERKEEIDDVEAIVAEVPTVTIAGQTYKLRRLGIQDTFKLARIVAIGAAGLGGEVGNQELSPELFASLFLIGFPYAEKQVFEFLGSILGVKPDELRDPQKFPMGSEVEIVNALIEHVDVKAFFSRVEALLKTPAFRALLKRTSTSSKNGMDGQTKKS